MVNVYKFSATAANATHLTYLPLLLLTFRCVWGGTPVSWTRPGTCVENGKTYNVLYKGNFQVKINIVARKLLLVANDDGLQNQMKERNKDQYKELVY
jgi:hypothetical protein